MENNEMNVEVMETAVIEDKTNDNLMTGLGLLAGYGGGKVIELGLKWVYKKSKPKLGKAKDHILGLFKKSKKEDTVDVDSIDKVEPAEESEK